MEGQRVGNAYVEKNGLYTHFQCECNFSVDGIYKIDAIYGQTHIDLGVCVPKGKSYITSTGIPSKKLGEGEPAFRAIRKGSENVRFIPVEDDTCFRYLKKLVEARFQVRDGQKGLYIKNDQ